MRWVALPLAAFLTLTFAASATASPTEIARSQPTTHDWYRPVDQARGTLQPNPPGTFILSGPADINNAGQIVGNLLIYENGQQQGGLHGFLWDKWTWIDLGELNAPTDINDHGDVVGLARNFSLSDQRAYLWRRGTLIELGPEQTPGMDPAINDRGQVIVSYWSGRFGAYLWEDGKRTELPTLGGDVRAFSINERGEIIGVSSTASGEPHAFLWKDGVMTDLGLLIPSAINRHGHVLLNASGGGQNQAFVWDRGTPEVLPGLDGSVAIASRMSDRFVVGSSRRSGSENWTPVLWEKGRIVDLLASSSLDSLSHSSSSSVAVNHTGEVVLYSPDPNDENDVQCYHWKDRRVTDLGSLGGTRTVAFRINDRGQIAGFSSDELGRSHTFLWEDGVMTDIFASSTQVPSSRSVEQGARRASPTELLERDATSPDLAIANPSRTSANLGIRAPEGASWQVAVFSVGGQRVRDLGTGVGTGRLCPVHWDGRSDSGSPLRSGVYWVRVTAGGQALSRRLIWLGH